MGGIKLKLTILNFLEFFIFGAWLLSFGKYMFVNLQFTGGQIGGIFMTLGFASLIMPGIMGMIADRWSPNKLFALSHILGALLLYNMAQQTDYDGLFWASLFYLMLYMPSIGLDNTISYCILERNNLDVIKAFPPIRVWGTIGFIIATLVTDSFGWGVNHNQFYFAAGASVALGLYTLTLPDCAPEKTQKKKSISEAFGLDAFKLFADYKMATFFIFALLLGAALQITNMYGEAFLHDFGNIEAYKDTFAVKHNGWVMSLSQISETIFILTIPFFLKKFGIKKVMLMSMVAWFLRFFLFGIGSPIGIGLGALLLSNIVYGMAFDFFNISGSLFVEQETDKKIRGSAQGLFIMMTNGFGAILGAYGSGYVVDLFTKNDIKDWATIWFVFAVYAIIIAILFAIMFKYKHNPDRIKEINH